MPAEFDITDKVVFISGAGRGIGKGIAQVLAEPTRERYGKEPCCEVEGKNGG